ncbi:MAG: tryptophan--tRNA ligase [Candidatus Zambryskibacteria bacterium RIFCSPLOWO2_02_FULL_39_26]|uniref:Tryptophan--tRNA ligase n=1 Tax=Candidatus Zambryskibacteria bacterium RIFCSPLOWO2_12_FULL_39_23 TaxID=1802776 RepID=A0A1G2UQR2_9BACT|nr:MAG: tryptophan--tRNA ligase [Candidatus Zambryskibacteria bacterium RIFCSPHIGHO2_12_FULL_39_47]OHB10395.1 MAG: tryptophan--tRNA ligase [Candidatus Zambryskibacteria bacterium RIFCSPLOWO2_02_FULL_39_26]OHB11749.1 MAG: tryptophan--tRNA ligase [Candidatus Zambryskibacteria bacterium RIFCSPLOWO2_12_FULL_39_23]
MSKKTLLSGIQPSGQLHIGNYFGAIKQFIDMQDSHNAIYMIVDYHALNTIQDKKVMSENILNLAIDYLALGLDPKKSIIFKQSDVSEHTELCWIFDTITTMPFLMRAHAYKDAEANNKEISVGKFNYPMLMAADILLYDTDIVPVGQDQRQHVEYSRDTAQKFNNVFKKDVFKLPEPKILDAVAIVPGTDGRKMSKSYGNTIPLFATDEEIEKAVMGIVTDSSGDVPQNVYAIHRLLKSEAELKDLYENSKGKYKVLKEALIIDMKAFVKPLREKREQLAKDIDYVLDILKEGGKRAKIKAEKKMEQVKSAIGVDLY